MKNTYNHHFPAFLMIIFLLSACNCAVSQQVASNTTITEQEIANKAVYHFPYNLGKPDKSLELPKELLEISGLTLSPDEKHLWVVQDEDGIVFAINKKTGEVEQEIEFGKSGDYEGIEQVDGTIYVVKSSGKIYAIKNPGEATQEVVKYNTVLNKDYDVEGLGYDPTCNALLLACKGQPEDLAAETFFAKAIYHFHLDSMGLDREPAMIIDRNDIIDYFKDHPVLLRLDKNGQEETRDPKNLPCYPSAIAIHPITGNIYITSSKGKILFITSPEGKLIYIENLDKDIHPQPEGLAFEKDGTLYISNEGGKDEKGKIYRFDYHMPKNQ